MQSQITRNKEVTSQQLEIMRTQPSYLRLSSTEFILYNLVNKESNSGLFKNQRLLILDVKNQTLSYLSKVPQGLIPFRNQQEVLSQQPKQKILRSQIQENGSNTFSCRQIVDKACIEIKMSNNAKKIDWVLYFSHSQLMKEWFRHISFLFYSSREEVNAFYHGKQKVKVEPQKVEKNNQNDGHSNRDNVEFEEVQEKYLPKSPTNSENPNKESPKKEQTTPLDPIVESKQNKKSPGQPYSNEFNELNEKISDLQKSKQHESQFNQFEEMTPLGTFLRSKTGVPDHKSVEESEKRDSGQKSKYFQEDNFGSNYLKDQYFKNSEQISKEYYSKNSKHGQTKMIKSKEIQEYSKQSKVNPANNSEENHIQKPNQDEAQKKGETIHRSGVIVKNLTQKTPQKSNIDRDPQLSHNQWNRLYYQEQITKSTIYFDFVNECLQFITTLIDELPFKGNTDLKSDKDGYAYRISNGVEYKFSMKFQEDESLIYELSDDQLLVSDLYAYVDKLKCEFATRKQFFHGYPDQKPPLIVLISYKQITVLCRALTSFEPCQVPKLYLSLKPQDEILSKMYNITTFITSSADFYTEMRKHKVALLDWGYLYKKCNNIHFQTIFVSEIICKVFLNILQRQLFQLYFNFPIEHVSDPTIKKAEEIIAESSLQLIRRLFGEGHETDSLWKVITRQTQRIYDIEGTKEKINENYLLYAILYNYGMFNTNGSIKIKNLFQSQSNSSVKSLQNNFKFRPLVYSLDYQTMSTPLTEIKSLLATQGKVDVERLLKLKSSISDEVPSCINYLQRQIDLKLTEEIPYNSFGFQKGIYNILTNSDPSNYRYLTALSAVRWLFKENPHQAGDFSYRQSEDINYYAGKNPLIPCFFQAIAEQQFLKGQYQKGVSNYKMAIDELSEIFQRSNKNIFRKRIELSDIYLELNQKDECMKELQSCRSIYQKQKMSEKSQYIEILLKLSKITLAGSKINEAINTCLQCLKNIQSQSASSDEKNNFQKEFLEASQILLRAYEVSKRIEQSFGVAQLCLQRCKTINNFKSFPKIIKLVLFPYLKQCDIQASGLILTVTEELSSLFISTKLTKPVLFEWAKIHSLLEHLQLKIPHYFKHLKSISDKISHQSLLNHFKVNIVTIFEENRDQNESIIFLMDFFLMTNIVGISFFQGFLKDTYY